MAKINELIYNEIIANNNIITTDQVLALGFSKTLLTNYVKQELLVRVRHGVYTLPNAIHDDMYTLGCRSEHLIFSHETALFLNGLLEECPSKYFVTIPTNTSLPNSIKRECNCFYIKPELHQLGVISRLTPQGNLVYCYDAERTICDLLRSKSRIDEELAVQVMKTYVASPKRNLSRLALYAVEFNVQKIVKLYMSILL